jgi:hypothetical protein
VKLIQKAPKSRVKLRTSWIPWTNSRLALYSGYGAGITSPGWYEHLWSTREDVEIKWLSKAAQLFRREGMDISTAHVLEAYRLTRALCQMRNRSHVTLQELNEATLTVMCMGDDIMLDLIGRELIIGDRIGTVPDEIPKVPLQQNFEKTVKVLRLKLSAIPKLQELDLRNETDLRRSVLFHRLGILGIPWAASKGSRGKGTFKESWTLEWQPEMMIALIDKSFLGNTIEDAADQQIKNQSASTDKVSELTALIDRAISAELNDCVDLLLSRIDMLSAGSVDVQDLMAAIPRLIHMSRYGNVRKSDLVTLEAIADRLAAKICINLPNACYGLDEDASTKIFELISSIQTGLKVYGRDSILSEWYLTLHVILNKEGVHDIILGCVCRLLLDAEQIDRDVVQRRISFALSTSRDPHHVASWIEGFLRGSGMILIYDHRLWNLLYEWIATLERAIFIALLPYLRRAFSKFQFGERRQIGQKAKEGLADISQGTIVARSKNWNEERATRAFDTLAMLFGNDTVKSTV